MRVIAALGMNEVVVEGQPARPFVVGERLHVVGHNSYNVSRLRA